MSHLELIVNMRSTQALYEQIEDQIRTMIMNGTLEKGTMLPSVRMLSQKLGVSIITTRRAYTDLEQQGFVETVPAKGTFVSGKYLDRMKQLGITKLREMIMNCVLLAKALDLSEEDVQMIVKEFYAEDFDTTSDYQIMKTIQMIHQKRF